MVRAPPGTCVPDPGIPSKNHAEDAIHPVAQEATRAQNSAIPGLMGARRAPARPASVATGTAGSAATLAAIPHTGTDPDRDTTSGAVANSARAGTAKGVETAVQRLQEKGAKKAVILPVSAPFHSTLMAPAAKASK